MSATVATCENVAEIDATHAASAFVSSSPECGWSHRPRQYPLDRGRAPCTTPTQTPASQVSPAVHGIPSSHGRVLLVWMAPVYGSHESVVHGLPSSMFSGPPGWQEPPPQVSPTVQALLSLHGTVLFAFTHRSVSVLHESVVQRLLSSQLFEENGS